MRKHIGRLIVTAIAVVVAAVPAILADPSFAHYVASHPWAATYLPVAAGVVKAIAKGIKEAKVNGSSRG